MARRDPDCEIQIGLDRSEGGRARFKVEVIDGRSGELFFTLLVDPESWGQALAGRATLGRYRLDRSANARKVSGGKCSPIGGEEGTRD